MADQANGLLSPYLREKRIKAVLPYINGNVLDYGCGVGFLAENCDRNSYFGMDIDSESIKVAKCKYPMYRFGIELPYGEKFDTIVLLAVIEHIGNKEVFLKHLKQALAVKGKIVLTTPHPLINVFYSLGSRVGLFSSHAGEEHGELLNYKLLNEIVSKADLKIYRYKRFLLGANQLCVITKK